MNQSTTNPATTGIPLFDALSDNALIRASQLIRNPKHPERPVPLQISLSTLRRFSVPGGTFPLPVRVSKGVTAWRVGDIRAWMNKHQTGEVVA